MGLRLAKGNEERPLLYSRGSVPFQTRSCAAPYRDREGADVFNRADSSLAVFQAA